MKEFTIAAIQWGSWPGENPPGRRKCLESMAHDAAGRGAGLVVLPRLAGSVAFGDDLVHHQVDPELAESSCQSQLQWFKSLSSHCGVYLAGSVFQKGASGWLETGYVFSPEGEIAGRSVRVHVRSEAGRLIGGDEIEPIELPWGRVGLLIGDDAWSPEQCRILTLAGCDVLLSLQAIAAPFRQWKQVAGLWQLAQQNQVYGAESCLVGGGFAGVSAIMGPCEIEPRFSGYLAQTRDCGCDAILMSVLSSGPLQRARHLFPIFRHFNVPLYDEELPRAFSGGDPE